MPAKPAVIVFSKRLALRYIILLVYLLPVLAVKSGEVIWKTPRAFHVARQCEVASSEKVFVLYDGNYQTMSLWSSSVARDLSGALLSWDIKSNSLIRTYDRCSGLSDHKIAYIRYCRQTQTLLVVYENGNIDILDEDDNIVNLPQLRDASIAGKTVNDVVIDGTRAYISTDFGLVVVDVAKCIIEGVYQMKMAVKSIAIGDKYCMIAAKDSVCSIPVSANFNDRRQIQTINRGTTFQRIVYGSGHYFVSTTKRAYTFDISDEGQIVSSRLVSLASSGSSYFTDMNYGGGHALLVRSDGHLLTLDTDNPSGSAIEDYEFSKYLTGASYDGRRMYLSEGLDGFSVYEIRDGEPQTTEVHGINVESPMRNLSYKAYYYGNRLYVTGGRNMASVADYNSFTMSYRDGNRWYNIDEKGAQETLSSQYSNFRHWNAIDVAQDPNDPDHLFVSAFRNGLEEYRGGKFVKLYNSDNSPLSSILPDNANYYNYVSCSALRYDSRGNLWLSQQQVGTILRVKKTDGTWVELHSDDIDGGLLTDQMLFTSTGLGGQQIRLLAVNGWVNVGLFGFTVNDDLSFSRTKHRNSWLNQGGERIEFDEINCMMEDIDGSVWLGTEKGLYIIENVSQFFENGTIQLKQIIINRNDGSGLADYLFDGIRITALVLDADGNKWVGTDGNGVYRISGDGQEEQYHFDTHNSPMPSNIINGIAVNRISGEIAICTMDGLALLETGEVAPAAELDYDNILVYPNPVQPGYHGMVSIEGLTNNAEVKILSSSGQMVWYGTSVGGLCQWNGHARGGGRVASGIYHVVCSTEDGSEAVVARIVMMK